jgi:hypothetical protein
MNTNKSSTIHSVDAGSQIQLFIWKRCDHSRELLQDLQQLPENVQEKIKVIHIEDALEKNICPPGLKCTPCLFVKPQIGTGVNKQFPMFFNGRKSILLYCGLRSHESVNTTMNTDDALGKQQVETIFEKTTINEYGNKDDVSKFKNGRQFDFVDSMQTSNNNSQKHDRLFNDFVDDPLLANDPRINRDPKKDLAAMMESRGYTSGQK